ncbi:unnamed protein product [Gongylonema pulchrum]|uniref:UBC core domain-containing protein n=1 Tax=Gongylonema pulchrum TaxID=637853 RepID=A0A183E3A7_9BILA|nr:unnamed protein product [Gongylonema pulchrum]
MVLCEDGSEMDLPYEASAELRPYNYRFDPEFKPISNDCTEIQLLIPPLRLVIPTNYPESKPTIWRDRWSYGGISLTDVNIQFDKRLNMAVNCRTITEIIHAWKLASEHALKIGSTSSEVNAENL